MAVRVTIVKGYMSEESQRKIALFRIHHPTTPLVVVTKPILTMMEEQNGCWYLEDQVVGLP